MDHLSSDLLSPYFLTSIKTTKKNKDQPIADKDKNIWSLIFISPHYVFDKHIFKSVYLLNP